MESVAYDHFEVLSLEKVPDASGPTDLSNTNPLPDGNLFLHRRIKVGDGYEVYLASRDTAPTNVRVTICYNVPSSILFRDRDILQPLSAQNHVSGIITIREVPSPRGTMLVCVTEHSDRGTLEEYFTSLQSLASLAPNIRVRACVSLILGLEAFRTAGVPHGRVRPSSLLYGDDGMWKVTGASLIPLGCASPEAITVAPPAGLTSLEAMFDIIDRSAGADDMFRAGVVMFHIVYYPMEHPFPGTIHSIGDLRAFILEVMEPVRAGPRRPWSWKLRASDIIAQCLDLDASPRIMPSRVTTLMTGVAQRLGEGQVTTSLIHASRGSLRAPDTVGMMLEHGELCLDLGEPLVACKVFKAVLERTTRRKEKHLPAVVGYAGALVAANHFDDRVKKTMFELVTDMPARAMVIGEMCRRCPSMSVAEELKATLTNDLNRLGLSGFSSSEVLLPLMCGCCANEDVEVAEMLFRWSTTLAESPETLCGVLSESSPHTSPLHEAATHGHVELCEALVTQWHTPVDVPTVKGMTALYLASVHDRHLVVQYLTHKGADVWQRQGEPGATPMHAAAVRGNIDVMVELRKAGASVSMGTVTESPVVAAATAGQLDVVAQMLEWGVVIHPDDVHRALGMAASIGHVRAASALIEYSRVAVESLMSPAPSTKWTSPVILAAANRQDEMVTLLAKHGAGLEAKNVLSGVTALTEASSRGHVSTVRCLIGLGASLEGRDGRRGGAPLHHAAEACQAVSIRALLEAGADVTAQQWKDGGTAAHAVCAANEGDSLKGRECLEMLIRAGSVATMMNYEDSLPLHVACSNGHVGAVELLLPFYLSEGRDLVNAVRLRDGVTALGLAVCGGHTTIVTQLLRQQQRVAVDAGRVTPLYHACRLGMVGTVRQLLERGADVERRNGMTRATALTVAAEEGQVEVVKVLVLDGKAVIDVTAFHAAVAHGRIAVMSLLAEVSEGKVVHARSDVTGATAIHAAASAGLLRTVKHLLSLHADPNVADFAGVPPLWAAFHGGHFSACTALLDGGADPTSTLPSPSPRSLLFTAASRGAVNVVQTLLGRDGVDVNEPSCDDGSTAFFAASEGGHADVVLHMLRRHQRREVKLDVNARRSGDGATALFASVWRGHTSVAKRILLAGKDDVDVNLSATTACLTPLHVACKEGYVDLVKMLTGVSGCDVDAEEGEHGVTPLWIAASRGSLPMVAALLGRGADVNKARQRCKTLSKCTECGLAGSSPLARAVEGGHRDVVKALVDAGADVHAATSSGVPVLHVASGEGDVTMVKHLLASEIGVNVNLRREDDGSTALHAASKRGHSTVVVELLKMAGVEVDAVSREGRTPLVEAAEEGRREVCRLLMEAGAEVALTGEADGVTSPLTAAVGSQSFGVCDDFLARGIVVGLNEATIAALDNRDIHLARMLALYDGMESEVTVAAVPKPSVAPAAVAAAIAKAKTKVSATPNSGITTNDDDDD